MSDLSTLEIVGMSSLMVTPGDVLVVRTDNYFGSDDIEHYSAQIREQLPDGVRVLILHGGMRLEGVIARNADAG